MSFLHPLFLLGLGAVMVPIVLHLARRRTQAAQPWSTLRFLRPSPPRLERRRRIEHWILLLLRAGAVLALAAGFARPFFTRALPAEAAANGARQVLLIDVSASMRRPGLWDAVLARVRTQLRAADAGDRLALLAFDGQVRALLTFDAWAASAPAGRVALAEVRLAGLSPGWGATDLGAALVAAAEAVLDDQAGGAAPMRQQSVVLFSDLQQGAQLGALGPAEWPAGVGLRLEKVGSGDGTNLGLHALPEAPDGDGAPADRERLRVKVVASAGGTSVTARLRWADGVGLPIEVTLAAGDSQVVPAPVRPPGATEARDAAKASEAVHGTLLLEGDGADFDNQLALARNPAARNTIVYLGADQAKDAAGSLYFLSRAFPKTRGRAVEVEGYRPDDPAAPAALPAADLVVLGQAPSAVLAVALRAHLAAGRTVIFSPVAGARDVGEGLAALTGAAGGTWREAAAGREAVLSWVDLTHPLLAPFADGRSADFTKVRFWKHRVVDAASLPGARVLARFDDGAPAWLIVSVGRGQVFVLTSGWSLDDSQLALSSKLVPLLWSLLEGSAGGPTQAAPRFVGDVVTFPPARRLAAGAPAEAGITLRRPDDRLVQLSAASHSYADTGLPGLYQVTRGFEQWTFAVNVAPGESDTAPLPLEIFYCAGIPLLEPGAGAVAAPAGPSRASERQRQTAFFAELEAQQKPWRWLLLLGLLLLLSEALLTARGRGSLAAPARSSEVP